MGGGGGTHLHLLILFPSLLGSGGGNGGGGMEARMRQNLSRVPTRCGRGVARMGLVVGKDAAHTLLLGWAAVSAHMGREGDARYGSPGGGLPAQTSR